MTFLVHFDVIYSAPSITYLLVYFVSQKQVTTACHLCDYHKQINITELDLYPGYPTCKSVKYFVYALFLEYSSIEDITVRKMAHFKTLASLLHFLPVAFLTITYCSCQVFMHRKSECKKVKYLFQLH